MNKSEAIQKAVEAQAEAEKHASWSNAERAEAYTRIATNWISLVAWLPST